MARDNVNEHNRALAEDSLVTVGCLIDRAVVRDSRNKSEGSESKCFVLQGANIVTLPAVIQGTGNCRSLDTQTLLDILFSQEGTFSLDSLTRAYLDAVRDGEFQQTYSEDVADTIYGFGIMSQVLAPVESITRHVAAWKSRSIICTHTRLSATIISDNPFLHQIWLNAHAAPQLSLWQHFDSLLTTDMSAEETQRLQAIFTKCVEDLVSSRSVYFNVPPELYNQ